MDVACRKAGRAQDSVALMAVSKAQTSAAVMEALEAGQRLFGENRVQEARAKYPALKARYPDLRLHLIGPLQTNKASQALDLFDVIETLDRPRLAEALAGAQKRGHPARPCLIEVNLGQERQKSGIASAETADFLAFCRALGLNVTGLMGLPPLGKPPAPYFALLRDLARELGLCDLSMGMSGDFEEAIAQGATIVRLGTALFGARHP